MNYLHKSNSLTLLAALFSLALLVPACQDTGTTDGGTTPDTGTTPDGGTLDGATPDGATPDGATPDGATPDGATPDGGGGTLAPVALGSAGNFVILSKSGIDTVPASVVTGDMGVSPIDSTGITGFSLVVDASNEFSTSTQVTGHIYAPDYAAPTPSMLTTAVGAMETAYTDAAGRTSPDFTELGAGAIGGMTLVPGLYKWGTDLGISTDVTLAGGPTDVWIFQIAGGLNLANGIHVNLSGGALPKNIFWQSFGQVQIGTTAHMEGILLSQTGITLGTGATVNGRLMAQTSVTLDQSTVTQPAL